MALGVAIAVAPDLFRLSTPCIIVSSLHSVMLRFLTFHWFDTPPRPDRSHLVLPSELCREIVLLLRDSTEKPIRSSSTDDTNGIKSSKEWFAEIDSLFALRQSCRTWQEEVDPVLFSELVIYHVSAEANMDRWRGTVTPRVDLGRWLRTTKRLGNSRYLKRVSIDYITLRDWREEDGDVISELKTLNEILSLSSGLRHLIVRWEDSGNVGKLIRHLSSLHFPSLQTLHFKLSTPNKSDQKSLGQFIVRNPSLKDIKLETAGGFNWHSLRRHNPLPRLECFDGDIAHMRLLGSTEHLASVRCKLDPTGLPGYDYYNMQRSIEEGFGVQLARLDLTFHNVVQLDIGFYYPGIPFSSVTLRTLAQFFPALRIIVGFFVTHAFLVGSTFIMPISFLLT